MKNNHLGNERGFALTAILVVVALIAVIGAYMAFSNRDSASATSQNTAKVLASTIINEAATIRGGSDKLQAGGMAIGQITLDTTANTGIYDPVNGGCPVQYPPASALVTTTNTWVYKVSGSTPNIAAVVKLQNVGTAGNAQYLIDLPDVTYAVCQQTNNALYGSTTINTAGSALVSWNAASTAIDASGDAAINGRVEQCIKTSDGHYVYYKTTLEQ